MLRCDSNQRLHAVSHMWNYVHCNLQVQEVVVDEQENQPWWLLGLS